MTRLKCIRFIATFFWILFPTKAVAVQTVALDPSNEGQLEESLTEERHGNSIYTLRKPMAGNKARKNIEILNWGDLRGDFILTNSDDGRPKQLTPFSLILFETSGNLSTIALIHLEQAMDSFLFPEIDAVHGTDNRVASIITEVESQDQAQTQLEEDRNLLRRNLQYVSGSRLRMNVNVTFDREPSPPDAAINENVVDIMQNLTYFLTNLSALQDPELQNVTVAYRQELAEEVEENPIILEDQRTTNRSTNTSMSFIIPILCGIVVMVAVTVMLVLRRRRRRVEEANKKVEQDLAFLDEESNLFSFENSPSRTQGRVVPMEDGEFVVTQDSVFEGLDTESQLTGISGFDDKQPHTVHSPTSLLSHNTMFSASTIKASNARAPNLTSPSSRFGGENGSLFAFSEEEEGAGEDSDDSKAEEKGLLRRNNSGNVSEPSAQVSPASDNEQRQSQTLQQRLSAIMSGDIPSPSTASTGPRDTATALGSPPTDGTVEGSITSNDTTFINLSPDNRYSLPSKRNVTSSTSSKKNTSSSFPSKGEAGNNSPSDNAPSPTRDSVASSSPSQSQDTPGAFPRKYRRHTKSTTQDGTSAYQTNTMQPRDWSVTGGLSDDESLSDVDGNTPTFGAFPQTSQSTSPTNKDIGRLNPLSPATHSHGNVSAGSISRPDTEASSPASASRQLINDLVWLSKKIAGVRQSAGTPNSPAAAATTPPNLETVDSLSYASQDASLSQPATPSYSQSTPPVHPHGAKNIVCRDCFAPPGKLSIVIHSTKDGPAVHEVKEGSSLEGHIFPGDLIISVDNVDTRSYTAAQLMKMMTEKARSERKITVLHFEYDK